MFKKACENIIHSLWSEFRAQSMQVQEIEKKLQQINIATFYLDHFAIIDLPSPHSGIAPLKNLFSLLGYIEQGQDYLPNKQNDFLWMKESDCDDKNVKDVLPQVVVADFRLDEMPIEIKKIIEKYSKHTLPCPSSDIQKMINENNLHSYNKLKHLILYYLSGRDWPLPTCKEFLTVHEFNTLLSWVLIFGRRPNHFTLSIHLLHTFHDLADFLRFMNTHLPFKLNEEGGLIKGSHAAGLEQAATLGLPLSLSLADGEITIPSNFVEFIWRYPHNPAQTYYWKDYYNGFIASQANQVIESLAGVER